MRAYDFAPLYRSTVGFDRMFSMFDQLGGVDTPVPGYPPYNIDGLQRTLAKIVLKGGFIMHHAIGHGDIFEIA